MKSSLEFLTALFNLFSQKYFLNDEVSKLKAFLILVSKMFLSNLLKTLFKNF